MTQESLKRSIRTYTGIYVDVFDPKPEMFVIEDIAHALSMIPRFLGHTPIFYTVAQHSLQVTRFVEQENKYLALEALLHDAAEAYLGDVPSPQKHDSAFDEYRKIEEKVEAAIQSRFNLIPGKHPIIKSMDNRSYAWEADMRDDDVGSFRYERPHRQVEHDFLNKFYELYDLRKKAETTANSH